MPTNQELLEVIQIQTAIAQKGRDLGEIMDLVVDKALEIVRADGAAIELAEGGDMVYRAVSGIADGYLGLRLQLERSMSGLCVLSGQALRCDDSETDQRANREACRKIGLRSMIIMPFRFDKQTVGVLKVMATAPGRFSQQDIEHLSLICDLVGAAIHYAVRESDDNLFHMATHDQLTGFANRALFMDRMRKHLAQCLRKRLSLGVLIIDMDDLKAVNDAYGHRTGTAVIKEFSNRTAACARQSDTLARLGGDEFGMILDNVDTLDDISAASERIQSSIEAPFLFAGRSFKLRASIGGAIFPDDSPNMETLLEIADQRMYTAKRDRKKSRISQDA